MSCPTTGLQTVNIPLAGLGSWQSNPGEVEAAIDWALEAGVRLIDTAAMYRNEAEIGAVLQKWLKSGKLDRKDLFVVTKLPMMGMKPERVREYIDKSLKNLGIDYLDLYLVHSTLGVVRDEKTDFLKFDEERRVTFETDTDLLGIWREMEKMYDEGKTRSIGVSNWNSEQLERISAVARVPIATNQIECHLYFQQKAVRKTMEKLGIKTMAYAPLGSPGRDKMVGATDRVLDHPTVVALAKKYGKTPAQVLLRHLAQQDLVVIPKSIKQHRIKENFEIFDFSLSWDEMAKMDALDKGSKAGRSFTMDFLKSTNDVTSLPEYPIIDRDEY